MIGGVRVEGMLFRLVDILRKALQPCVGIGFRRSKARYRAVEVRRIGQQRSLDDCVDVFMRATGVGDLVERIPEGILKVIGQSVKQRDQLRTILTL